jgi:hypothetical protein
MARFISIRNEQLAELVSRTDEQVVLKMESGEEKSISPATLKRWWKPMEDEEAQEQPQSEVVEKATQEEATEAVEEPAEGTEKTPKQKRKPISGERPLKDFIEQLAIERGTEVFKATVPSFRSLKVGGRMYMAFTFNKKGITLWMRSKAVLDLTQFKKMNHMFDARVHFDEATEENKEKITKLLDASLEFQKNKQAGKASKK